MELMTEKKVPETKKTTHNIPKKTLEKAYRLMQTANNMAILYDENRAVCSKYVHSTSRGHEAIQLAAAFYPHLKSEH